MAIVGLESGGAHADDSPAEAELTAARALFAKAEHDEDAEQWQAALDKLKVIARVRQTAGVRYHVALCEEHLGALADALADFTAAEEQAAQDGARDVSDLVGGALGELTPRVPHVVVRVGAGATDVRLRLDGKALDGDAVGRPIAINPGPHRIVATAAGKADVVTDVAAHERETTIVELRFVTAPAEPPLPPSPAVDRPRAPASNEAFAVAATAGAVGLAGFGVIAFLLGGSAHDSAVRRCAAIVSSADGACEGLKNGVRAWDWTAAASWAAAAGAGALSVVFWTHQGQRTPSAGVFVGPSSVGVVGTF